jgi:hypothetical protein
MQNYSNHRRLYPAHHFILTPLTVAALAIAFTILGESETIGKQEIFNLLAASALVLTVFIARIYALKNQNRIIRLEMRYRYFELTGKSFKEKESQLSLSQIIALRFAGDDELLPLIDKSITEKLSNKQIKQNIKNWQADYKRV